MLGYWGVGLLFGVEESKKMIRGREDWELFCRLCISSRGRAAPNVIMISCFYLGISTQESFSH